LFWSATFLTHLHIYLKGSDLSRGSCWPLLRAT
jgi:hypothetical protein